MEEENNIYDAAALSQTQGGMLILKIEKFLKKPSIEADLSGILHKYYEKILNNLKRKIVDINFTEAALLLQSCSLLYAKKIGILWNVTIDCQKRMIEFEVECRKRKEKAAIEDGRVKIIKNNKKENKKQQLKQKSKIKRHKIVETLNILRNVKMQRQRLENNPTVIVIDDNNYNHQDNRIKTQNLLNIDLRQHCIVEPNGLIHEEVIAKQELLTYVDNLNCLRLINTVISDEIRFKVRYFFANCKEVSYFYESEIYLNDFIKEKNISVDDVEDKYQKEFNDYMYQRRLKKEMLKEERLSEDMLDDSQDVMFDNMVDFINPMTTKKVDSNPRHSDAISNSDSAFHEMRDESYPASVASRRKSDSLFGETISGTNEEDTSEKNIEDTGICDTFSHTNEDSLDSVNEESSFTLLELRDPEQVPIEKSVEVTETQIKLQTANTNKQKRKIECYSVNFESDEEYVSPKKRTRKISLAKLIKVKAVAPLKVFERFYKLNYEKSENECGYDCVVSSDSEDEDELNNCEETMAVDLSRSVTPVESALCEINENVIPINTDSETVVPRNINSETVDVQENNDSSIEICYENIPESILQNKNIQYAQIQSESTQRVKEWQCFVIEKIKNLEEKSDFDIYDYSNKIINLIPLNETKKFSYIANGKSAAEVSKLFMTALIMTNTNNIAILNVPSGKLANETFELKMLNTRCQHEDLQYYKAPSEMMSQQGFDEPLPSTSKVKQNKRMKLC